MEKYCRAGQATDDNMTHAHCMLVPKATYTHSEYVTRLLLHGNNGCTNALCTIIRSLPVLFTFVFVMSLLLLTGQAEVCLILHSFIRNLFVSIIFEAVQRPMGHFHVRRASYDGVML